MVTNQQSLNYGDERAATQRRNALLGIDPTYGVDAESAVIGSITIDHSVLSQVQAVIGPDDFRQLNHRIMFTATAELLAGGIDVDRITLMEKCGRRLQLDGEDAVGFFIRVMESVPNADSAAYYARIVKRASLLRQLDGFGRSIASNAADIPDDLDEFVATAQRELAGIADSCLVLNGESGRSKSVIARIRERNSSPDTDGILTGFAAFDDDVRGLHAEEFIIVAAKSNVGKSTLMGNMAVNMCQAGKRVGIVTLEMADTSFIDRMTSQLTGINATRVAHYQSLGQREQERVDEALEKIDSFGLLINESGHMTVAKIAALATKWRVEEGIDCLFVDYLGLISPTNPKETKVNQIAFDTRALKPLAKELRIPIVAGCQVNRASYAREANKDHQLNDLRDSGAIENDADVVCFINRHEASEIAGTKYNLSIAKRRSGTRGRWPVVFNPDRLAFYGSAHANDSRYENDARFESGDTF